MSFVGSQELADVDASPALEIRARLSPDIWMWMSLFWPLKDKDDGVRIRKRIRKRTRQDPREWGIPFHVPAMLDSIAFHNDSMPHL